MAKKLYLNQKLASKPGLFSTKRYSFEQTGFRDYVIVNHKLLVPYSSLLSRLLWDDESIKKAIEFWGKDFNGFIEPINAQLLGLTRTHNSLNAAIANPDTLYKNLKIKSPNKNPITKNSYIWKIGPTNKPLNYHILSEETSVTPEGVDYQLLDQDDYPLCIVFPFLHQISMSFKRNKSDNFHIDINKFLSCLDFDTTNWKNLFADAFFNKNIKINIINMIEKFYKTITELVKLDYPPSDRDKILKNTLDVYIKVFALMYSDSDDVSERSISIFRSKCFPISQISVNQQCEQKYNVPTKVPPADGLSENCDKSCLKGYYRFLVEFSPIKPFENRFARTLLLLRNNSMMITFNGEALVKLILLSFQYDNFKTWESVKNLTIEEIRNIYIEAGLTLRQIDYITLDMSEGHAVTLVQADKIEGTDCYNYIFQNSWKELPYFNIEVCDPETLFDQKGIDLHRFWSQIIINAEKCEEYEDEPELWNSDDCEYCDLRCTPDDAKYQPLTVMDTVCSKIEPIKPRIFDKDNCECVDEPSSSSSSSSSSSNDNLSSSSSS